MKTYPISEMAEIVKTNKANIRRFINRNNLKEHRPQDRKHANSTKYYDEEVFKLVKKKYGSNSIEKKEKRNSNDTKTQQSATSDTEIVVLLKEQLKNERQDKQELLKLLNQQQQLTFMANKKIETLQIELGDANTESDAEPKETKPSLFNRLFKRDKE